MGARRYNPDTTRFVQEDLYGDALGNMDLATDPLTQNRYSLAGGNPVSFIEVDGHRARLGTRPGPPPPFPTRAPDFDGDGQTSDVWADLGGRGYLEQKVINGANRVAEKAKDAVSDDGPEPYDRNKHYGGSHTDSPAAKRARAESDGKPCPECGKTQRKGDKQRAPSPEHDPPLRDHYYKRGGKDMSNSESRQSRPRSSSTPSKAQPRSRQSPGSRGQMRPN